MCNTYTIVALHGLSYSLFAFVSLAQTKSTDDNFLIDAD